jgi:hypothetical protein
MSTYWYFECLDHAPTLRSSDEFTQHTDDSSFKNAVELANSRPIPDDWTDRASLSDDYFTANACRFLSRHPKCQLGIVSEYDDRRLLDPMTAPVDPREALAKPNTPTPSEVAEQVFEALSLEERGSEWWRHRAITLAYEVLRSHPVESLASYRPAHEIADEHIEAAMLACLNSPEVPIGQRAHLLGSVYTIRERVDLETVVRTVLTAAFPVPPVTETPEEPKRVDVIDPENGKRYYGMTPITQEDDHG